MINIPNILTIARILLVPVIVSALLAGNYPLALAIFLVAGVTDALDGFIARRFNMCTRLGAMLDPLADKLLVVPTTLVLAATGRLPWWLALTVVARDLLILGGAAAFYARTGNLEMEPSIASKVNTCVQITLIVLILADSSGVISLGHLLVRGYYLALLTAVVSGLHYLVVWGGKARSERPGS
jgi:cardiolipin synthase